MVCLRAASRLPAWVIRGRDMTRDMTKEKRLAGLAVGLMVLTSCLPPATPWVASTPTSPRLAVVGDSQIYSVQHVTLGDDRHRMTDFFTSLGYAYSESSEVGAATTDLEPFGRKGVAGWPDEAPQILVEALGTNDMHAQNGASNVPIDVAEQNLTTYLDRLPSTRVVFVEIPETTPWRLDQFGPAWNAFLADQAARRGGQVVPWASLLAQHLTGPGAWAGSDQVHLTGIGKLAFLLAIAGGVVRATLLPPAA